MVCRVNAPAAPGTPDYLVQREVLLELMVAPPEEGDRLGELAQRLGLSPTAVARAVDVLAGLGLAERGADVVRASAAARAVEALLEVRL